MRQIKIVRGGHSKVIDLYSLLMHGAPSIDIRLRDGDRIVIPPIGPTVAVAGNVKRPGIYELRPIRGTQHGEKINLDTILDFAGGAIRQGENRFIHLRLNSSGQEITEDISNTKNVSFSDGSILKVLQGTEQRKNTIELVGHTRAPGLYDFSKNGSLSTLLGQDQRVADDLYPLIGVIERWNPAQLTTQYLSFPVRSVFKKSFDLQLQKNDKVILFSNADIKDLMRVENTETEKSVNQKEESSEKTLLKDDKALSSFLREHSAHLRGSVREPGSYPVASGVTLDNILAVAGGFTLDANKENVEIISRNFNTSPYTQKESGTRRLTFNLNKVNAQKIYISPGDAIRANQKPKQREDKTVLVLGEVRHPGKYDLLAGDKLSHLIARAGGLTDQAYPEGAIFSREAERKSEELRFRAAARDMQNRLAAAVQKEKDSPDATQIALVQDLAHELAHVEPVGRITVEADPAMLVTQPELDMLLEGGDRLYIPKRPLTVRVSGEVLSPASLQFRDAKDPVDYIKEAGGFTRSADKKRTFVLYPDGSAQPLQVNNWNHTPIFIPPGSTIIVPHDPKPFDFMEGAKEMGQILSNLAITAVFIDDIRD
ncbi:MAG: hypothetical protein GC137_08210 [Alphaproteobacteria bacterium]|nr:hypothetical protein [Alphaproteobacteria bacterium]